MIGLIDVELDDDERKHLAYVAIISFGVMWFDMRTNVPFKEIEWIESPSKPQLQQTLSNNQIKGLVNTYNHNLYTEINEK
jgi:hypothetical protein